MKIGDWPFGPPGVDCRTCLRAPCRCAPDFVSLALSLFAADYWKPARAGKVAIDAPARRRRPRRGRRRR